MRARRVGWLYLGLSVVALTVGVVLDLGGFLVMAGVLIGTGMMLVLGARR